MPVTVDEQLQETYGQVEGEAHGGASHASGGGHTKPGVYAMA